MAKWIEGRYNNHRLDLGDGLTCSVDWTTTRNDEFPWKARVLGNDVGAAKSLEAAKKNAEKLADSYRQMRYTRVSSSN